MAISYVGAKGAGSAGQGGGSVTLTSGFTGGSGGAVLAGDLVVVTVSVGTAARAPTIAISTPSGYTPLTAQRTTATAYDTNVQTCYKVMGSTPDTAVTIPPSGNIADGIAYLIQVFRGVDQTTPMDVTPTYATGSGVSNQANPAAITPVTSGAWIVVCAGGAAATGTSAFTAAYLTDFRSINGADTNDGQCAGGYRVWTSGTYDPAQFGGGSVSVDNSWGATTMALRPFVAVTHDTTGDLSGQIGAVAGSAARADPPVAHDTSGVLSGQIGSVVGSAARFRAFPTSGALTGQGAAVAGSAARTREHPTSGALTGQAAAISGSAARLRVMSTSGALVGPGSEVAGSAARVGAPVTHATDGILVGPGSSVSGSAARSRAFSATGSLVGQPAQVVGAVARTRLHATSGVLAGAGSVIDGSAARSAAIVTHATSGQLVGAGSVLAGSADQTGSAPPSVGDYAHSRRRRRT